MAAIHAEAGEGASEAVLSRFENGIRAPRDVWKIVKAYEKCCGLPRDELWWRALDR